MKKCKHYRPYTNTLKKTVGKYYLLDDCKCWKAKEKIIEKRKDNTNDQT